MPFLLVYFEIAVLTASRTNIINFYARRSLYNLLSFSLLALPIAFYFLQQHAGIRQFWDRLEERASEFLIPSWKKAAVVLLLIVLVGILLQPALKLIYDHPIRSDGPDMLPLIRQAGERLLSLRSPFDGLYFRSAIPLTYFPAQVLAYLPAIALGIDLRLFSFLYFVLLLTLVFHFLITSGRPLAAVISVVVLSSSGMIHFFLSFTQLFPYLLLLALLFVACLKERIPWAAFFAGMLLVFRQTFWFVFPLFIIHFIKKKHRLTGSVIACLGAGILLGSLPYVFFAKSFFANLPLVAKHFSALMASQLFLKNSLGLTWYLYESRWALLLLQLIITAVVLGVAWRKLKSENLWFFFTLLYLTHILLISYNRPEEYYALPILVAACFISFRGDSPVSRTFFPGRGALAILVLAFFIASTAPGVIGKKAGLSSSEAWADVHAHEGRKGEGFMETVWRVDLFSRLAPPDSLSLTVDAPAFAGQEKDHFLTVALNEKGIYQARISKRFFKTEIPLKHHLDGIWIGANLLEISVRPPVPYRIKLVPAYR